MIPWLDTDQPFPPATRALRDPNGLLAAGADLSPSRLLAAYRAGIFPWYAEGEPLLWWSPDPRMVLYPDEFVISRSLRKRIRSGEFEIRADTAFESVISACAAPRRNQPGTWITDEMARAYIALHRTGHAHCIESWRDGELVGGLYGISIGRMFYGESMFARATDASKVALAWAVRQLGRRGCGMIDCQMKTAHLASLGAREIPREEFLRILGELVNYPDSGEPWHFDHDLFD